jgi:hypothetical protein
MLDCTEVESEVKEFVKDPTREVYVCPYGEDCFRTESDIHMQKFEHPRDMLIMR